MKKKITCALLCTLANVFLSAADHDKKQPLKPTPPPTPTHHSPFTAKKGLSHEALTHSATSIGIRTNTGEEQNLQAYLHHNLGDIHERLSALETQKSKNDCDVTYAALAEQQKTSSEQLAHLQAQLSTVENDYKTLTEKVDKPILVQVGEVRAIPISDALKEHDQKIEDIKISHNKRLDDLEEKKPMLRRILDHCFALSLIATGMYHYGSFSQLTAQAVSLAVQSPITHRIFPYLYIPAGLVFGAHLVLDIHQEIQCRTHSPASSWQRYYEPCKIVAVTTLSSLYDVIKPAGSIILSTLAINFLLAVHTKNPTAFPFQAH